MTAEGEAWLEEADGGGEMKLRARGVVSRAQLLLKKDGMEAAGRGTLGFIARRRSK
jgi:hypothetical protein